MPAAAVGFIIFVYIGRSRIRFCVRPFLLIPGSVQSRMNCNPNLQLCTGYSEPVVQEFCVSSTQLYHPDCVGLQSSTFLNTDT